MARRQYIKLTKDIRKDEKQPVPCSRDTLTRWIIETIRWAYANTSALDKI